MQTWMDNCLPSPLPWAKRQLQLSCFTWWLPQWFEGVYCDLTSAEYNWSISYLKSFLEILTPLVSLRMYAMEEEMKSHVEKAGTFCAWLGEQHLSLARREHCFRKWLCSHITVGNSLATFQLIYFGNGTYLIQGTAQIHCSTPSLCAGKLEQNDLICRQLRCTFENQFFCVDVTVAEMRWWWCLLFYFLLCVMSRIKWLLHWK